jgi:hypothetical protein
MFLVPLVILSFSLVQFFPSLIKLSSTWNVTENSYGLNMLNIPVNIFYSSQKGGGYTGINVGFNVQKSKKSINNKVYR